MRQLPRNDAAAVKLQKALLALGLLTLGYAVWRVLAP